MVTYSNKEFPKYYNVLSNAKRKFTIQKLHECVYGLRNENQS